MKTVKHIHFSPPLTTNLKLLVSCCPVEIRYWYWNCLICIFIFIVRNVPWPGLNLCRISKVAPFVLPLLSPLWHKDGRTGKYYCSSSCWKNLEDTLNGCFAAFSLLAAAALEKGRRETAVAINILMYITTKSIKQSVQHVAFDLCHHGEKD